MGDFRFGVAAQVHIHPAHNTQGAASEVDIQVKLLCALRAVLCRPHQPSAHMLPYCDVQPVVHAASSLIISLSVLNALMRNVHQSSM